MTNSIESLSKYISSLAESIAGNQWENSGRPENFYSESASGEMVLCPDAQLIMIEVISEIRAWLKKTDCFSLLGLAKYIWHKLGDVPFNEDDELDEHFICFQPCTDREEIWSWIEDTYDCSVANDLMYSS